MNSFDHSLKYLVGQQPADFISFGMGQVPVTVLRPLATPLPARDRDVDDVYLTAIEGRVQVAHMEYHRRHQSLDELAADVAEAQVRLFRREGRPVMSQVWDLYGSRGGPLLEDRLLEFGRTPGGAPCQSGYRRINLRALCTEELLGQGPPALWPLVPLTSDGDRLEAVRKARDAIEGRPGLPPAVLVRLDHLAVLLFMGAAEGLPRDLLRAYISMEYMMKSQSLLLREFFPEIFAEGEAKGEAKGKADTLVRILLKRFHYVDELLNQRIRAETRLEVLDAWLDEALLATEDERPRQLIEHIKRAPLPIA